MNDNEFWELIESCIPSERENFHQKHFQNFRESVDKLKLNEIIELIQKLEKFRKKCSTPTLSEAAYLIFGGIGDDGFQHFVTGIVAQGKTFFESCLDDPDTVLASYEFVLEFEYYEEFRYIPWNAFEEKSVQDISVVLDEAIEQETVEHRKKFAADYSEDETILKEKYPKLFDKFWK